MTANHKMFSFILSVGGRALIFAAIAGGLALATMRHGIDVGNDGWAYWECSVSLLSGRGYHYFGGPSITMFPLLFSLLLSGSQAIFGVSGATLIGTVTFLTAVTAFLWSSIIFYLAERGGRIHFACYIAALSISLYFGSRYHILMSETLLYALLGALLIALMCYPRSEAYRHSTARLFVISILLILLTLTRNAALAFWPPIAIILFWQARQSSRGQKMATSVALLVPLLAWSANQLLMRQAANHLLSLGGMYSPVEYMKQVITGLASEFGPSLAKVDLAVVLAVTLGCLVVVLWLNMKGQPLTDRLLGMLFLGATSLVGLFALFNVTVITDPLTGRFLWQVPPIVFAVLALLTVTKRSGVYARVALVCVLVLLLFYQGWNARAVYAQGAHGWTRWNVRAQDTVHPDYYSQGDKTMPVANHVLISPPDFVWVKRVPSPIQTTGSTP
jgi:hypothetical protein